MAKPKRKGSELVRISGLVAILLALVGTIRSSLLLNNSSPQEDPSLFAPLVVASGRNLTTAALSIDVSRSADDVSLGINDSQELGSVNQTEVLEASTTAPISPDMVAPKDLAHVNYWACCGLGHRLARMANAYAVAKYLNFSLRTYWGFCGEKGKGRVEIFQHLFGLLPPEQLQHLNRSNLTLNLVNNVGGYGKLVREGKTKECRCRPSEITNSVEFYQSLLHRFRHRDKIETFVNENFQGHTVLAMHVRAGNGEQDDFSRKGRGSGMTPDWIKRVSEHIRNYVGRNQFEQPPLLFLASDTPSMLSGFREELKSDMPVIDFPQERVSDGQGIAVFGGNLTGAEGVSEQQHCLLKWENALMDMAVLSQAHALFIPRASSFSATIPMSLVFDRKAVKHPVCEMDLNATTMFCHERYENWCCDVSWDQVRDKIRYEYVHVQKNNLDEVKFDFMEQLNCNKRYQCIPFDWNSSEEIQ